MTNSVLVAGARTPIGWLLGALGRVPATELGGYAIRAALERAGVPAADVEAVIMGQVLQAGCGQLPARQAAVLAGIPMTVPATTTNKVCLSGLDAIVLADMAIRAGDHRVLVAGGMESMSLAPHLLPNSRTGHAYGEVTLLDHLAYDGLTDVYTAGSMGLMTDQVNDREGEAITRADQDAYAVASHQRAARAQQDGSLAAEIVAVTVPGRRGETVVEHDEAIRPDTSLDALSRLRPSFRPDGTITAGSASPLSDGAAAVLVLDRAEADARGLPFLAEILGTATVAGPDSSLQLQPAEAIRAVCERVGIAPTELDLVEINEAFATVALASMRELKLDPDRVNADGGAIALGHPIGASGTRLALHLATALRRRGGGTGVAALCGGGGQGEALLIRVAGTD